MNDLISIIVPIYNSEKYLRMCLNSIIKQTYSNIEIILIDDGSIDNSLNICNKYKSMDKRIGVYHKENGGPSEARNFGIKIAKGKYVSFIDSDDYVNERFIEVLYYGITKFNTMISCLKIQPCNENEMVNFDLKSNYICLDYRQAVEMTYDDNFGDFSCNKMFAKELFNDIEFPKGREMEDQAIIYKLINISKNVVYNESNLYAYVQRSDSISHKGNSKFFIDLFYSAKSKYENSSFFFPDLEQSSINYALSIIYIYPYIRKEKNLKEIAKKDFLKLLPKIKERLPFFSKVRMYLYGLNRNA